MTLSIANLVAEIDQNDLLFQPLDMALIGAANKKGGDAELKFVTGQKWGMGPSFQIQTERQGFILWLDRQEVKNILANQPERPPLVPEKHENHLRLLRTSLQYLVEKGFSCDVVGLSSDDLPALLAKVDDLFKPK